MTNEEMVTAYRDGNEMMLTNLCRANERLVIKTARTFHQDGYDLDDFVSEAWLGFLGAVREFDGARGVTFASFASFKMRQHLINVVQSYGAASRTMPGAPIEIEDDHAITEPESDNTIMGDHVRSVVSELPAEERAVIEAIYYNNETQLSTAKKMGVSLYRARQLEASALRSMKKALSH